MISLFYLRFCTYKYFPLLFLIEFNLTISQYKNAVGGPIYKIANKVHNIFRCEGSLISLKGS